MENMKKILDKVPDLDYGRDEERTTTTGKKRGKVGHGGVNTTSGGSSHIPGGGGHVGLYEGKITNGLKGSVMTGQGHVGKWKDEDDAKGKTFGLDVGGKMIGGEGKTKKLKKLTGQTLSGDVEAGSANATAKFNRKEGFNLGLQANAVQGRGTIGNPNKNFVRGGGSAGSGFGVRGHWGKNDEGDRQLGFGMDVGPVTFDVGATGVPKWMKKGGKVAKKGGKQVGKMGKGLFNKMRGKKGHQ